MWKRLLVAAAAALVFFPPARSLATGGGPNGCGTDGTNRPSYWGYSRGWDEQLVGYQNYFCHLTRLEGNWVGSGPNGDTQGPSVIIENDGRHCNDLRSTG